MFSLKPFSKRSFFLLPSLMAVTFLTAQVPPQYQAGYNQMMKNQAFQNAQFWNRSNMHMFRARYLVNPKYEYIVTLKDSGDLYVKSKIHVGTDSSDNRAFLIFVDKNLPRSDSNRTRKIYCNETVRILRLDSRTGDPIRGIATDSCWLFKVVTGKISAYSSLSEVENISSEYLAAIKVENGPIEPLNPDKLGPVLINNAKAYNAFVKKNYLLAIKIYNSND
jgi:hypothetical protein